MDNLCHTLVGAAIGATGFNRRTRFATPLLMIASNLPDVDALVFATGMPSVAFRRGWTHGILAQALLPLVLTGAFLALGRRRASDPSSPPARAGTLLALSYLGVLLHVGMDWLNNYGVRLLMPFSDRWFYGDAVFIIDPWLWLALGAGVVLARRRRAAAPAWVALALAAAYVTVMVWSSRVAREEVLERWTAQHGAPPQALMVGPAPVNPFRKLVIVDAGEHYATGTFELRGNRLTITRPSVPSREHDPAVLRARDQAEVRSILVWARFPYYDVAVTSHGTAVTLQDMRFGNRVGSATVVLP